MVMPPSPRRGPPPLPKWRVTTGRDRGVSSKRRNPLWLLVVVATVVAVLIALVPRSRRRRGSSEEAPFFLNGHLVGPPRTIEATLDTSPTVSSTSSTPDAVPLPVQIRLLRIPKAGSSSFSAFLRHVYGCTRPGTTDPLYAPGECTKENARACPAIAVGCTDHVLPPQVGRQRFVVEEDDDTDEAFEDHRAPPTEKENEDPIWYLDRPAMTLLRDPVQRYLSAFRYPGHHGGRTTHWVGHVVRHRHAYPVWDDTMTQYLSGHPVGTWYDPPGGQAKPQPRPPPRWEPRLLQQRLREALLLVTHPRWMAWVGLLEFGSDTVLLFCRMYQCPAQSQVAASSNATYPGSVWPVLRQSGEAAAADDEYYQHHQQHGQKKDRSAGKSRNMTTDLILEELVRSHQADWILYYVVAQQFCHQLQVFFPHLMDPAAPASSSPGGEKKENQDQHDTDHESSGEPSPAVRWFCRVLLQLPSSKGPSSAASGAAAAQDRTTLGHRWFRFRILPPEALAADQLSPPDGVIHVRLTVAQRRLLRHLAAWSRFLTTVRDGPPDAEVALTRALLDEYEKDEDGSGLKRFMMRVHRQQTIHDVANDSGPAHGPLLEDPMVVKMPDQGATCRALASIRTPALQQSIPPAALEFCRNRSLE